MAKADVTYAQRGFVDANCAEDGLSYMAQYLGYILVLLVRIVLSRDVGAAEALQLGGRDSYTSICTAFWKRKRRKRNQNPAVSTCLVLSLP